MTKVIASGTIEYDETEFYLKFLHDLRSGLTIIGGYADLLIEEDGSLTEQQMENVVQIKKSYGDMIAMVNDVTDLIRINSATIKMTKRDFDLRVVISSKVDSVKPLLEEKDITLELNLPTQEMKVFGDDELMGKALYHIFLQVIGLLPMNSVIKLNATARDSSWIVSFKDNGPGIPPEEIPNLFQPFFISTFFSTMGKREVGLDLLIAKKIVALHKGKLWVESKPEFGTTVNLEIPVKKEVEKK